MECRSSVALWKCGYSVGLICTHYSLDSIPPPLEHSFFLSGLINYTYAFHHSLHGFHAHIVRFNGAVLEYFHYDKSEERMK